MLNPCQSRLIFPELSDSEYQALMYYAQGASIHCIADIMKISLAATKQTLQRMRKKLHLDRLESSRGVYNARVQATILGNDKFLALNKENMDGEGRGDF